MDDLLIPALIFHIYNAPRQRPRQCKSNWESIEKIVNKSKYYYTLSAKYNC